MVAMGAVTAAPDQPESGHDAEAGARRAIFAHHPRRMPQIRIGSVNRGRARVYRAHDPVSGRTVELGASAARILAACDGTLSIGRLIQHETGHAGDQAEATRMVLTCLDAAEKQGLVRPMRSREGGLVPPARPGLVARTLKNPLFARFSLFRPDPLVQRLAPLAHLLFSPVSAVIWLAVVGFGIWLAVVNWGDLFAYGHAHALAPTNLLLTLLLFPLVKLLHETGHALACKRWGGQVRDFGIALLVFIPIPFADCSDSAFFARRRQRIIVAAAGVMAEFVIAVAALVIWVVTTDPLLRQMAFNVVLISTVTTLVFNANPLLRYDAYYVVCDLTGIDNLASRSQAVIGTLALRLFLGEARPWPERGFWQNLLFVLYGVASFLYKGMIVVTILVSMIPRFFVFGVVLALWGGVTMVAMPLLKQARMIHAIGRREGSGGFGPILLRIGVPLLVLALFLSVPLPYAILTTGSVQLPPQSVVRAGGNGFLTALPAGAAATIVAGAPLALLHDDILDAEIASRAATLAAQKIRYDMLLTSDLAEAAQVRSEMTSLANDLAQLQARRDRLVITATQAGSFALAEGLRIGDFLQEGMEVGLIVPPDPDRVIMTALPQEDADLVRSRLVSVAMRRMGGDQNMREARLLRNYPLLTVRDSGGAPRPSGRFVFELALSETPLLYGQPVSLRFDLGREPLARQLWRAGTIWITKIVMSRYVEGDI